MEQKKFEAVLKVIVPQVIHIVSENYNIDEISASRKFYNSKLNELLEKEDTKLWHLSALTLYNMFDEENKTGNITFPEEA